jgi:hypothetical protein
MRHDRLSLLIWTRTLLLHCSAEFTVLRKGLVSGVGAWIRKMPIKRVENKCDMISPLDSRNDVTRTSGVIAKCGIREVRKSLTSASGTTGAEDSACRTLGFIWGLLRLGILAYSGRLKRSGPV